MSPGFFTDLDFKNPNPSVNKLLVMMFLIRFWRNLTKKGHAESAKYEINIFFLVYLQFLDSFSWIRIRIFWIRSRFLATPDPDKKKSYLDRGKKPGSETLVFITQI